MICSCTIILQHMWFNNKCGMDKSSNLSAIKQMINVINKSQSGYCMGMRLLHHQPIRLYVWEALARGVWLLSFKIRPKQLSFIFPFSLYIFLLTLLFKQYNLFNKQLYTHHVYCYVLKSDKYMWDLKHAVLNRLILIFFFFLTYLLTTCEVNSWPVLLSLYIRDRTS